MRPNISFVLSLNFNPGLIFFSNHSKHRPFIFPSYVFYVIKTVLFNDYILDKHCSESLVGRNFVPFQGKKEKGGEGEGTSFTESCRYQSCYFERSSVFCSIAVLRKRKLIVKFLVFTAERSKITFLIYSIN